MNSTKVSTRTSPILYKKNFGNFKNIATFYRRNVLIILSIYHVQREGILLFLDKMYWFLGNFNVKLKAEAIPHPTVFMVVVIKHTKRI